MRAQSSSPTGRRFRCERVLSTWPRSPPCRVRCASKPPSRSARSPAKRRTTGYLLSGDARPIPKLLLGDGLGTWVQCHERGNRGRRESRRSRSGHPNHPSRAGHAVETSSQPPERLNRTKKCICPDGPEVGHATTLFLNHASEFGRLFGPVTVKAVNRELQT